MEKETKSRRFLNYAQAIGALVAAVAAVAALWMSLHPEEKIAKTGYQVTEQVVNKLAEDLRKERDERVHTQELVTKDIGNLRNELQLIVKLLELRQSTRPAPDSAAMLKTLRERVAKKPNIVSAPAPVKKAPPKGMPTLQVLQAGGGV